MKPHAPACDRNRDPILAVLRELLPASNGSTRVLEIGSGTGQHAVHFAEHLPHLYWQTSDLADRLPGIRLWLAEAGLANLPDPLALDVDAFAAASGYDAVFTANTAHIVCMASVDRMLEGAAAALRAGGLMMMYGPFMRDGRHTSEGNRRFDASLRASSPGSGIRDVTAMNEAAGRHGLVPHREVAMPANNLILVWQKKPFRHCEPAGRGNLATLS